MLIMSMPMASIRFWSVLTRFYTPSEADRVQIYETALAVCFKTSESLIDEETDV
jgi:hypothetical protein